MNTEKTTRVESVLGLLPDEVEIFIENRSGGRQPERGSVLLRRVEGLRWHSTPTLDEPGLITLYDAGHGKAGLRMGGGDNRFEIIAHGEQSPEGLAFSDFWTVIPSHKADHFLHCHRFAPEVRAVVRVPIGV
ncbi:MAG TPA: hypothetical protein VG099_27390 [Gemmataceae bacterium]|jgi:hypothetical protein|nr:hypothetical protein [Gemmataceae bacterium]